MAQTFVTGTVLTADDINTYLVNADGTNRSLLHNGAMQVAQRSASVASITAGGYYTADRWNIALTTLGTWTQSVEAADAPTGSGLRKSLKMLCTTADASPAAGDLLVVQQVLEGQDLQRTKKGTANAEQLTASFWVKSNRTGTYVVELEDADNTRAVSATYTVDASATWEYKTVTFPADATGAFDNDANGSLKLNFWLGAGTTYTSGTLATTWGATTSANRAVGQVNVAGTLNNYWQITGVQLEIGPTDTPFEFKPYAQDLRECQRYYWRIVSDATYAYPLGMGFIASATSASAVVPFPVAMRANPSATTELSAEADLEFTWSAGSSVNSARNADLLSPTCALIRITSTGMTTGQSGYLRLKSVAGKYFGMSADL